MKTSTEHHNYNTIPITIPLTNLNQPTTTRERKETKQTVMMSSLPPGIHLSPNERLLCSHAIEYTDRMGTAFLTTLRMIVRVEQSSDARKAAIAQGKIQPTSEDNQPVQFTLPLANVTGRLFAILCGHVFQLSDPHLDDLHCFFLLTTCLVCCQRIPVLCRSQSVCRYQFI